MSTVEEIKDAISKLSENDYHQLSKWFSERRWGLWDKQIKDDSEAGRLDFLRREGFNSNYN
ncbi:MAG: hypothetical protein HQK91_08970 [Nitrospirae bacterium]|nr:hypothetical protein [Nitrospirota bacterium]